MGVVVDVKGVSEVWLKKNGQRVSLVEVTSRRDDERLQREVGFDEVFVELMIDRVGDVEEGLRE